MSTVRAPDIGSASIVLVGNFNPAIFHPSWFDKHGLIDEGQLESAELEVTHPEFTSFRIDWFTVRVETGRFMISSIEAPWVRIADMARHIFNELLPHTPVQKIGINKSVHFDAYSKSVMDAVGDKLAPVSAWGAWANDLGKNTEEQGSGLFSLTMKQTVRNDEYSGYVKTKLEPSSKIKYGIFMEVNDHYELVETANELKKEFSNSPKEAMDVIANKFDASMKYAEMIVGEIIKTTDSVHKSK